MRPTVDDRDNLNVYKGSAGHWRATNSVRPVAAAVVALTCLAALWLLIQTFDPLARSTREAALWNEQAINEQLAGYDLILAAIWRAVPLTLLLASSVVALLLVWHRWAAMVSVQAHYQIKALQAVHPQLPQHLTYAPRVDGRGSGEAVAPSLLTQSVAPTLPDVTDLAQLNHMPTPQHILLGLAPGGERIVVPMSKLWHVATAGPTGNGKSNIQRLLLAQLLALGAHVAIGDPKFTEYDVEQDEDWRPIARRLHLAPAVSADQIGALLDYAIEELVRRLERRRKQEKIGAPLFIALDELPWIYDHVRAADEQIAELVRLGRGVGVFILAAAQDFLVKSTGLGAARDNFRSAFYLGGDLKTGSVLLDMPQRELARREGELTLGVALLRSSATTPPALVRVPYVSNASLYQMLGNEADQRHTRGSDVATPIGHIHRQHSPHTMPSIGPQEANAEQATSALERAMPTSVEARRVAQFFLDGKDPAAIVAELRGVRSNEGKRYQLALAEVLALLREGLQHRS